MWQLTRSPILLRLIYRSGRLLFRWGLVMVTTACTYVDIRQVPFENANRHPIDGMTQVLALTKPAWLAVRSDSGSVTLTPVTVWDTDHLYEVRLVSGWFTTDRLLLQTPQPSLNTTCERSQTVNSNSIVCGDYVPIKGQFPDESAIMDRFRQSGQRVFVFLRPEPVQKSPH